jgi:hypothetical protein
MYSSSATGIHTGTTLSTQFGVYIGNILSPWLRKGGFHGDSIVGTGFPAQDASETFIINFNMIIRGNFMNRIYWASLKTGPLLTGGTFIMVYFVFHFHIPEWFVDLLGFI